MSYPNFLLPEFERLLSPKHYSKGGVEYWESKEIAK